MSKIPEKLYLPETPDYPVIKREMTRAWLHMAQLVNNIFTVYRQADLPTIPTNVMSPWIDADGDPNYYLVVNFNGTIKYVELGAGVIQSHKHSKLFASDGYPEAVTVDAAGDVAFAGNVTLTDTVWDDLPPSPILGARLGATAPTLATFVGGTEQYTFDATNDYVIGATEVTHKYKEGTNIYPHIHWATNGVDVGDTGVKWVLEYTVSNVDETAPFASAFPATASPFIDTLIPGGTPDRSHILSVFAPAITGTLLKIGTYICWKLTRTASATAAPAANPFALAVGFHVEMDTIGSKTISAK